MYLLLHEGPGDGGAGQRTLLPTGTECLHREILYLYYPEPIAAADGSRKFTVGGSSYSWRQQLQLPPAAAAVAAGSSYSCRQQLQLPAAATVAGSSCGYAAAVGPEWTTQSLNEKNLDYNKKAIVP